ncbi:hypothetical protein [Salinibaculum salinum]|uniref:hypothetical protein n=1 Tax=Salinibaculum salinum TaxID=3131996 RepID=UPI0030EEE301
MADWRRYTGTKVRQAGWTLLLGLLAVPVQLTGILPTVVIVGAAGICWVAGLVVLGLGERRHWSALVEDSAFDPGPSGHTADLQQIVRGQSVTVTTDVTGLLAPEHTQVSAAVEGVDTSFTVRIVDSELTDKNGVRTGDDALDDRFVITGAEGNVAALLTETIRDSLLTVEVPGAYTIRPDRVVYEIPFTRLTAKELDAAGDAVAILAAQLEAVGQQ